MASSSPPRQPTFRLVWRIYLFASATLILSGVVIAMASFALFDPPKFIEDMPRAMVSTVGSFRGSPEVMERMLHQIKEQMDLEISLYTRENELIASNVSPPLPPLAISQRRTFLTQDTFFVNDPRRLAVALTDQGAVVGYGLVVQTRPKRPPLPILHFGVFFLCLLITSLLFARHLTRPISTLARTAQAFGAGDLKARARLSRRDELGEVARAFDEMAERIEQMIHSQNEMLANIAHELRTPLARIHVALDLADLDSAPEQQQELANIAQDLKELEDLVNEIILMARLDLTTHPAGGGTLPLHLVIVGPQEIIDSAFERFTRLAPARRLEVLASQNLPEISADPSLLRRALDNLLDNARKYSTSHSLITLRVYISGQELIFEVEDQGIGIREEDLSKIFKPFYRADVSRSRATGGVGLGLALARSIVEAHHGAITLINREDEQGVIARFSIPLPPGDQAPSRQQPPPGP